MPTACWEGSYCMLGGCLLHTGRVLTTCWEGSYCMLGGFLLHTGRVPTAYWEGAYCILGGCLLHAGRVLTTCWEGSYCLLGGCLLHAGRVPTACAHVHVVFTGMPFGHKKCVDPQKPVSNILMPVILGCRCDVIVDGPATPPSTQAYCGRVCAVHVTS